MLFCCCCSQLNSDNTTQPEQTDKLAPEKNREFNGVEYTSSSMERIRITTILEPDDASSITDEEALELLGMLYYSYSIVDAWFINPPGNLVVDKSAQPYNDSYYPVKELDYQGFRQALFSVFGGDEYLPGIYDQLLFLDVDGVLYINMSAEGQIYSYLPDINEPAIVEKTTLSVTYEVPIINSSNVRVGSVTVIATRGRDIWTFTSDLFRDIVI